MPGSGVGKLREAESMAENGRARSRERVIESERSGEGEEAGRMKQQRSCNYGRVEEGKPRRSNGRSSDAKATARPTAGGCSSGG